MIRQDFLNELASQSRQQEFEQKIDAYMESIQSQMDSDMAGWVPSGGEFGAGNQIIKHLPLLRRESRLAFFNNPHGKVALRTVVKFTIGGGVVVDFHEKRSGRLKKIMAWWKKCTKTLKWFGFCREYVTRAVRDGEVFVRRTPVEDPEMPLRLRYLDPDIIAEGDQGIKTATGDVETVISYHLDGLNEDVPAEEIHHFKGFNADRNMRRGRPNLEVILPTLAKYSKWLDARLTLSLVRNSVAIVKQVNGTGAEFLRLRNAQTATRTRPNETNKAKMLQPGTILQGTPGVEYKMLGLNLDARDAAEDGRTFLLAAASGAGLPDVFMTADYSGANFASTVVSQNPAVREFEEIQQILMEELADIVDWLIADGIEKGQIPADSDTEFDITFPPILRADTAKENNAYALMNEMGVISKRTWALKMGLDPDQEQEYISDEILNAPTPAPIPPAVPGQPVPPGQPGQPGNVPNEPKRVQDRQPRQNNKVGESENGETRLTVIVKKADEKIAKPKIESGGNWPRPRAIREPISSLG